MQYHLKGESILCVRAKLLPLFAITSATFSFLRHYVMNTLNLNALSVTMSPETHCLQVAKHESPELFASFVGICFACWSA